MRILKKAVVDIDNTLWHFCGPLYERLKKINPAFPPPEFWIDWNFWMQYCSEDEFMGVIHEIHLNQDSERFYGMFLKIQSGNNTYYLP